MPPGRERLPNRCKKRRQRSLRASRIQRLEAHRDIPFSRRAGRHAVHPDRLGAIAQALYARLAAVPHARLDCVVVRRERVAAVRSALGPSVAVQSEVPEHCRLLIECAGHSALFDHVEPALARGTECAVLSIGALHEDGLAERLADTAARGGARLHLLAGAIGGIDAIAAARFAGLDEVVYTGRKPPSGWRGSPAERLLDLDALREPAVFLEATAREAARLYPKNANVAATLSLAGLGLDATRVRLIADPGIRTTFTR